jgi:hypothetical protein
MGETGIGKDEMELFTHPVATDSTEEIEMEAPTWAFSIGIEIKPSVILACFVDPLKRL